MKITFQEESNGHSLSFNTDWTTGKKYLDLFWEEMTIIPFNKQCDKENEQFANVFAQIDEMCSHCRRHATIINQEEHIKLCESCYDKMTDTNNKETFLLRLNKVFTNGKMTYNDRHELQQLHDTDISKHQKRFEELCEKIIEKDKEIKLFKSYIESKHITIKHLNKVVLELQAENEKLKNPLCIEKRHLFTNKNTGSRINYCWYCGKRK